MMTLLEPAMGAAVLPDVRTVHYVNDLLPSRQYQRASPTVKTSCEQPPAQPGPRRRAPPGCVVNGPLTPEECGRWPIDHAAYAARAGLVEQGADLLSGLHGFVADLVQPPGRIARG